MMLQDQLAEALAMGSDSSDEEVRERRARTLRQKYATRQVELMDVAQQIRDMTAFVLVSKIFFTIIWSDFNTDDR